MSRSAVTATLTVVALFSSPSSVKITVNRPIRLAAIAPNSVFQRSGSAVSRRVPANGTSSNDHRTLDEGEDASLVLIP